MNPDFTPNALIENINTLCLGELKVVLPTVIKMFDAMKPSRKLSSWECFAPHVLAHFIVVYYNMPRFCYVGKNPHPRVCQHLQKVVSLYDYKQFLDREFSSAFVDSYFKGLVAIHNKSIEEIGVSIFYDYPTEDYWSTKTIE